MPYQWRGHGWRAAKTTKFPVFSKANRHLITGKDEELIALLQANAHARASALARKLGLAQTTVPETDLVGLVISSPQDTNWMLDVIGATPDVTGTESAVILATRIDRR